MNQKVLSKVFIWGFLFLYLLVAGISFCHAVQFFNIGNVMWMAATLAFAFELGLALSLAAILLSDENKKNTLPWILMIILTFVQVVGNVYSTFKYISLSDVDYYIYLQKPLLFWIEEISQETVQIIISWIIGAILPIVALFMTDMVASNMKIVYMKDDDTGNKDDDVTKIHDDAVDKKDEDVIEDHNDTVNVDEDATVVHNDIDEYEKDILPESSDVKNENTEVNDDMLQSPLDDDNAETKDVPEEVQEIQNKVETESKAENKEEESNKHGIIESPVIDQNVSTEEDNVNAQILPNEHKADSNEILKNAVLKQAETTPKVIKTDNFKEQDIDRKDIPNLNVPNDKHNIKIVPNELITSSVK